MVEEKKEYKNKVMFLRKSEKGEHLFAFDREGILGEGVESILINVSDVRNLLNGRLDWVKVSAMGKTAESRQDELGL